jgi:GTP-binding protein HflX
MKVDPENPVAGAAARRGPRKAVLLGIHLPRDPVTYDAPLEELARLADTAGFEVVERVVQRVQKRNASTFIGKGKADEVGALANALGADLVIVDHDISGAQSKNLSKAMNLPVMDRTELILDIFATRARTLESKAQIELAQMEYSLPRLKRLWTHLSREVSSGSASQGSRGPGESQLETDRRLVRFRIHALRREIKEMQTRKSRRVEARGKLFTVALVGYTNAGKSTLMNALTGADVFVEDRLFATLETTTRAWDVKPGRRVFLSDTVGFIENLPHHLVASFLTTLEEARRADLLLHVIDAHDPDALKHVTSVEETLSRIDAGGVPRIAVLNQIDRVQEVLALRVLEDRLPGAVRVSALTGEGLDRLGKLVLDAVEKRSRDVIVVVDPGNGRLLARLREWGSVEETTYPDGEARVRMRLPSRHFAPVRREGGTILDADGKPIPPEATEAAEAT